MCWVLEKVHSSGIRSQPGDEKSNFTSTPRITDDRRISDQTQIELRFSALHGEKNNAGEHILIILIGRCRHRRCRPFHNAFKTCSLSPSAGLSQRSVTRRKRKWTTMQASWKETPPLLFCPRKFLSLPNEWLLRRRAGQPADLPKFQKSRI